MPLTTLRSRIVLGLTAVAVAFGAPLSAAALTSPDVPRAVMAPGDPLRVTVMVPLTVPPNETGLLDAETLERYTTPLGLLTRQLDAVIDTPVAIGLDPLIPASIRVLGTAAPASALAWLERLSGASNEVFALAYADADVAAAARAGALDALTPIGFDFAIDPANFGAAQTATPSPEPTTDPGEDVIPPLPTTDDVLAWPYTLENVAWPADDTLATDDVVALGAAGYETVVVSSDNVSGAGPTVALGDVTGIVSDDALSAFVRAATYASAGTELQDALAALEDALASAAAGSPGRNIVVTLDRRWPFGNYHLLETVAALAASPSVDFGTLSEVVVRPPSSATIVDKPEDETRIAVIRSALAASGEEARFATVLEDTTLITAPRRLEFLALLGTSWLDDPEGWATRSTEFLAASTELLDSVRITQGSDQVLLARDTDVRVAISNELDHPATVRVTIVPQRPLLRVMDNDLEVVVEADSTKTVDIPVEAIANGEVTILVTITSTQGVIIDNGFVRANLQAEWETVGTAVIIGLLVIVLLLGIVRTVVRRRRAKNMPTEESGD